MRSVLITGATGLLGVNLIAHASSQWRVVGVSHSRKLAERAGVEAKIADLSIASEAYGVIGEARPDVVINCVAATNVDACETDPERAIRLNVTTARNVAMAARTVGARLVHVSTDAVYDGEGALHSENEKPAPRSVYAKTKLEAETAVLVVDPGAAVARVNFFGEGAFPGGLANWLITELSAQRKVNGFSDVYFSPMFVGDLASALLCLAETVYSGVINVGGDERLSKYEFAMHLATVWRFDPGLIAPVHLAEARMAAPRPIDSSMLVDRARSLGICTVGARQGLERMYEVLQHGYRETLQALVER